ncbi:MAG: sulfurtransferase [Rhodobacterales bacterium]|nr:MAG: sulfurtransferase [Rhodobacterales bacterium]
MFGFMRGPGAAKISAQDAIKGVEDGSVTVIDVREPMEVAQTGKAKGALHIPMMLLQSKADPRHPEFHPDLNTSSTIALYCASGARSASAAQMLAQMGFSDVRNIGGLHDWARAGGAIEQA